MQNWQEIWEKRESSFDFANSTPLEVVKELRRVAGYDIVSGAIPDEAWDRQFRLMLDKLSRYHEIHSLYEVGCGSGANLFLAKEHGITTVGGIDFSHAMLQVLRRAIPEAAVEQGEAKNITTTASYDAVISSGVFIYFPNLDYAQRVLEKMVTMANHSLALLEIYDEEQKEAWLEHRRQIQPDYDQKYEGLNKLFYPRSFFEDFAREHNLELRFTQNDLEGYWNNAFDFDVYLYKKD